MNLDDRMKMYERASKFYLPRRQYTIIRVDGKAFHTFTRGCDQPFDDHLHQAMCSGAIGLCSTACGAMLGYVQSDEISVVLQDFAEYDTQAWFDNKVQKIASVAASAVTAYFNVTYAALKKTQTPQRAMFDARVFSVPTLQEACNYLMWRQQDATRNSVQSAGFAHFSNRKMHGKKNNEVQEMLFQEANVNWNDYPEPFKRGSIVLRATRGTVYHQNGWVHHGAPEFSKSPEYLAELLTVTED